MMRTHALVWAALVAAAVGVLFYTSHQAQELEAALEASNRSVIAEREAIRILRAEWAYLNEPGRLRELARRHTPLGPAMPVQVIAAPDDIPMALPGVAAVPGIPLPPRKPLPGALVSAAPETGPAVAAPANAGARQPGPTPSSDPLRALLANFRAQQSTAQAGPGQ